MHGYVLCEYALTFQKTHFHPYLAGEWTAADTRTTVYSHAHVVEAESLLKSLVLLGRAGKAVVE